MGMPIPADTEWTAEMVRALPEDGKRYEVLDGELFVTPAPRLLHQRAISTLYELLSPFVASVKLGELLCSPADIEFSPRRLVQPDLFVAPLVGGRRPRDWTEIHALVLAIEVLSPSTARADRHHKRRIYMSEEVDEYWIVDLDARVIERWQRGRELADVEGETLVWQPASASGVALTINVVQYFAGVLDED
jgi:Uma2 family endonuclease